MSDRNNLAVKEQVESALKLLSGANSRVAAALIEPGIVLLLAGERAMADSVWYVSSQEVEVKLKDIANDVADYLAERNIIVEVSVETSHSGSRLMTVSYWSWNVANRLAREFGVSSDAGSPVDITEWMKRFKARLIARFGISQSQADKWYEGVDWVDDELSGHDSSLDALAGHVAAGVLYGYPEPSVTGFLDVPLERHPQDMELVSLPVVEQYYPDVAQPVYAYNPNHVGCEKVQDHIERWQALLQSVYESPTHKSLLETGEFKAARALMEYDPRSSNLKN